MEDNPCKDACWLGMIVWLPEKAVLSDSVCSGLRHEVSGGSQSLLAVCSALLSVLLSPSSLSFSKTKAGETSQVFLVRGLVT